MKLKIEQLKIDPAYTSEWTLKRFYKLVQSIREQGVMVPLVVEPCEGGYRILDGKHRYWACIINDIYDVECYVI